MSHLTAKIMEEIKAVIPPTIFFFVALHIVAVIRMLMTRHMDLPVSTTMSVLLASLILGKAVLIADMLPFINRFPEKPLAYNVCWKTAIYLVVAGVVHYVERLFDFARQAGGVIAGNDKLLAEMVWPHFWAIEILLLVLILMYCTTRELARAIGTDKFTRMFFGPLPLPKF